MKSIDAHVSVSTDNLLTITWFSTNYSVTEVLIMDQLNKGYSIIKRLELGDDQSTYNPNNGHESIL